jgi:hypothetical protein
LITLNTEMSDEPRLTAATVTHHVVGDLLSQHQFSHAHFPEVVDLAVINTGLGALQNSFGFVKQTGSFWDSTYWDAVPRPFLDTQCLAYANAIAAWIRGDQDPVWANGLSSDLKRPMQKSLKYLFKTDDSFFHPSTARQALLQQPQHDWLLLASESSSSKQIVAIRHLQPDERLGDQQESLLLEKLRSSVQPVVLNSISATERLKLTSEAIADELRFLAESRDDEVRAKAMIALAKLGQLDEAAIGLATKMVDSSVKFVVYAGMFALSTLESVGDPVLKAAERGFVRALQTCDYEFVSLFVLAFNRWLENPNLHIEQLLRDNDPEYLEIANEALQNIRERSVALG